MSTATAASTFLILAVFASAAAAPPAVPPSSAVAADGPKALGAFPVTTETSLVIRGIPGQIVVTTKSTQELRFGSRSGDKSTVQRPISVSFSGTTVTFAPPAGVTLPDGILRVEAPASFAVRIEAQAGTVIVDGFTGAVAIVGKQTVVRAQGLAGPLTAELEGGSLSLTNLGGAVTARLHASCAFNATGLRGALDLNSQDGTFKVQTIGGACRLESHGGSGELAGLAAGGELHATDTALKLSAGRGDVTVTSNAAVVVSTMAGAMRFELDGGSLRGQDIQGSVTVRARRTEVTLEGVSGEVNLDVTRANVALKRVSGAVSATVFAGDAKLFELAGPLRLDMDGGTAAVTFAAITGDRDSQIENRGGDVSVRFPGAAACRVSAKSKTGRITSELLSIKATPDGTGAEGSLGTVGKPLITIEADGNIQLSGGGAAGSTVSKP